MSQELDALQKELAENRREAGKLHNRMVELERLIKQQRLTDWLKDHDISIHEFPMNAEIFNYVVQNGVPGTYIEYEIDKWKPGTIIEMKGMFESGNISAGPFNNHGAIIPQDMIIRAINEYKDSNV